jgi:hypothetical protein
MTDENATVTLPATVEKIIPPVGGQPEKAQIAIDGAEHLYREVRVDNKLVDDAGNEVKLKVGAPVEVTIEAPKESTIKE